MREKMALLVAGKALTKILPLLPKVAENNAAFVRFNDRFIFILLGKNFSPWIKDYFSNPARIVSYYSRTPCSTASLDIIYFIFSRISHILTMKHGDGSHQLANSLMFSDLLRIFAGRRKETMRKIFSIPR
jgi:hypothetical protein